MNPADTEKRLQKNCCSIRTRKGYNKM